MDMTLEERRSRLKKRLDIVKENVTEAIINQHIFWEVQDIIRHNPQLRNTSSAFYQWMGSTFVLSSALAVRIPSRCLDPLLEVNHWSQVRHNAGPRAK